MTQHTHQNKHTMKPEQPTMKTPRTNAAKFRIGDSDHFAVHVAYVEQLERELAAMTDLADRLAEALQNVLGNSWDGPLPDYARHKASAVRVAYENYKTQTP